MAVFTQCNPQLRILGIEREMRKKRTVVPRAIRATDMFILRRLEIRTLLAGSLGTLLMIYIDPDYRNKFKGIKYIFSSRKKGPYKIVDHEGSVFVIPKYLPFLSKYYDLTRLQTLK